MQKSVESEAEISPRFVLKKKRTLIVTHTSLLTMSFSLTDGAASILMTQL